jgi:hypothetical protein
MLKRIKHISIFVIATFYVLQLTPLFPVFFIENIKDIRNKIQISKLHLAETKELSISFWNTLPEKKEFKINGIYYDVISYKRANNKIIAKVIKDSYEDYFKIALDDLFCKKENSHKDKKKVHKLNLLVTTLSSHNEDSNTTFLETYYRSNYRNLKSKTKKIVVIALKPPC